MFYRDVSMEENTPEDSSYEAMLNRQNKCCYLIAAEKMFGAAFSNNYFN